MRKTILWDAMLPQCGEGVLPMREYHAHAMQRQGLPLRPAIHSPLSTTAPLYLCYAYAILRQGVLP